MKIMDLIKKPGFWAGVAGLLVIIAQLFGLEIDAPYVNEILSGVCSVLVIVGFLSAKEKEDIDKELDKNNDDNNNIENDKLNEK